MDRNIKLLAFFNFFTDLKFHSAILIIYFANVTGSYLFSMSLFSVEMISSALFEIPTGMFSDIVGRKKTVMLGAVSAVVSAVFYALGFGYWWLFLGAVFAGLSKSWYSGNNDAFLHDTLSQLGEREFYDEHLGKVSSMFQFALTVGALAGSVLASWSFPLVMWLSIIPQIICLIIASQMIEPKKTKRIDSNIFSHLRLSALGLWKNKTLRLLSISSILGFGVGESIFNFRAAFVKTLWPIWAIGFSNTLSFIGAAISFRISGKLIRRIGAYTILIWANIYSRIIHVVATAFPTVISPALISTTSLFYGARSVAESKLMQKEFSEVQRATMDSLNSLLGSLFYGMFAVFIGYIGDLFGPANALLISQLFMLPIVFIYWYLQKINQLK